MGATSKSSGCCGGCFSGMKRGVVQPDCSPPLRPQVVKSMSQALQIRRPQEGTWTPSPNMSRHASPGSPGYDWASPAPRYPTRERNGHHFEFDLVVDETAAPSPLSEQLDSDGARQR